MKSVTVLTGTVGMDAHVIGTRYRAPLVGEHNRDIYEEIGLSGDKLAAMTEAGII